MTQLSRRFMRGLRATAERQPDHLFAAIMTLPPKRRRIRLSRH